MRSRIRWKAWELAFRSRRMERKFQAQRSTLQARNDLAECLLSIINFTVWVHKAGESGLHLQAAYCWVAALTQALTVVAMLSNWQDYSLLRNRIVSFTVPVTWFYCLEPHLSMTVLDQRPVGLAVLLLIRFRVVVMMWTNLALKLPLALHMLVHGAGLIIVLRANTESCRVAIATNLQHMSAIDHLVSRVRSTIGMRAPPAGSLAASQIGSCRIAVGALQVVAGYLLPCFVSFLLEVKSRRNFAGHYLRQRGPQS